MAAWMSVWKGLLSAKMVSITDHVSLATLVLTGKQATGIEKGT